MMIQYFFLLALLGDEPATQNNLQGQFVDGRVLIDANQVDVTTLTREILGQNSKRKKTLILYSTAKIENPDRIATIPIQDEKHYLEMMRWIEEAKEKRLYLQILEKKSPIDHRKIQELRPTRISLDTSVESIQAQVAKWKQAEVGCWGGSYYIAPSEIAFRNWFDMNAEDEIVMNFKISRDTELMSELHASGIYPHYGSKKFPIAAVKEDFVAKPTDERRHTKVNWLQLIGTSFKPSKTFPLESMKENEFSDQDADLLEWGNQDSTENKISLNEQAWLELPEGGLVLEAIVSEVDIGNSNENLISTKVFFDRNSIRPGDWVRSLHLLDRISSNERNELVLDAYTPQVQKYSMIFDSGAHDVDWVFTIYRFCPSIKNPE